MNLIYKITYENPNLNKFMTACGLGVERVCFTPKYQNLNIRVDRESVDEEYISKLGEHILNMPLAGDTKVCAVHFIKAINSTI